MAVLYGTVTHEQLDVVVHTLYICVVGKHAN